MERRILPSDGLVEEERKDLDEALKENEWFDWDDLRWELEKEVGKKRD